MRILVMGAGAVGSAIGGYLSDRHDVLLAGRGQHMEAIRREGLTIQGILGSSHHTPLACSAEELVDHPFLKDGIHWILLTVKSSDTAAAMKELLQAGLPGPYAHVAHIQNGLGNLERLQETLVEGDHGHTKIVSGMTITGYDIVHPGIVNITVYGGPGKVGSVNQDALDEARELAGLLDSTPLVFEYTGEITSFLWAKFLYNCCLNPLGALLGVPYGLLKEAHCLNIMRDILQEAFALARIRKVPLFWESPEEYFQHLLNTLIPATASHEPSMLADLNRGRATEIDALNGYLVMHSEQHDLPCPVNHTIVRMIRSASSISATKNT